MGQGEAFRYEIQYTSAADRFFKKHETVRSQYEDAIRELLLGEHPERVDVKRIRGKRQDCLRVRLANYRVVYADINGRIVVIQTQLADPRGEIYKKMSGFQ